MPQMRILTETDLRGLVPLDLEAIAAVEGAFEALATKAVAINGPTPGISSKRPDISRRA